MHINEMFNPSLDCFIRTGSTDQRGRIHFHPFNARTQFSIICWFWKHPPAGLFFFLFFPQDEMLLYDKDSKIYCDVSAESLSWYLLYPILEKKKKERKFYNQNLKQTYSVVFHFRNMMIKLNLIASSSLCWLGKHKIRKKQF